MRGASEGYGQSAVLRLDDPPQAPGGVDAWTVIWMAGAAVLGFTVSKSFDAAMAALRSASDRQDKHGDDLGKVAEALSSLATRVEGVEDVSRSVVDVLQRLASLEEFREHSKQRLASAEATSLEVAAITSEVRSISARVEAFDRRLDVLPAQTVEALLNRIKQRA